MLWGALNNATQGMMSMSWGIGSISQNIANVNTYGYKEKITNFKTVMSESHPASGIDIFAVKPADSYAITRQGVITPSNQWSDMAINGRGFFIVSNPTTTGAAPAGASLEDPNQVMYTRDGAFFEKAGDSGRNYLVTSAGQYLMGWAADETGVVDPGMLVPVYTTPYVTQDGVATTELSPVANIPSDATATPAMIAATANVTDAGAATQTMDVRWTRVNGNDWTVSFGPTATGGGTVTTADITVTLGMDGSISSPPGGLQDVVVDWGGTPTTTSIDLSTSAPVIDMIPMTMTVYDAAFEPHSVTLNWEKQEADSWVLRFDVIGTEGTLDTTDPIEVTFDGSGKLLTPNPPTATMDITWLDPDAGTSSITINLDDLTQFVGEGKISIHNLAQDGYGSGRLNDTEVSSSGEIIGNFSNGHSRVLYKIPVATFVSEDNLDPISGNLFRRSQEAGEISVKGIDEEGSGAAIVGASVENSNVDLGDQFSRMIVTQKAYSCNANVFKTADEMTTTARDLKA